MTDVSHSHRGEGLWRHVRKLSFDMVNLEPRASGTSLTEIILCYSANCELRLTLIHSYEAVDILHSDILKPSMPLTHLKAFFCEQVSWLSP